MYYITQIYRPSITIPANPYISLRDTSSLRLDSKRNGTEQPEASRSEAKRDEGRDTMRTTGNSTQRPGSEVETEHYGGAVAPVTIDQTYSDT